MQSRMTTRALPLIVSLIGCLALVACDRHTTTPVSNRTNANAIAVRPEVARSQGVERATGMTEESDESAEVTSGFSPLASAVAANTPAVAAPIPSKWIEGKNYNSLSPAQPTSAPPDKVEAVEVFWYGCGHCYHLDPFIESWRQKGQPAYVMFQRVPVMWGDVHKAHARLFYTVESLGKLEQLHSLIFREIHQNGNFLAAQDPVETERLQRAFLKANGVSDAEFDRTYHSFSVESKLQRADQLTHRYKVTGVPMMVVNGKYTTDVAAAGGESQLLNLVNDLATSERKR